MNTPGGRSSGRLKEKGITKRPVISDGHTITQTKRNKAREKEVRELPSHNSPPSDVTKKCGSRTVNSKSHLLVFKQRVRSPSDQAESSDDGSEWECWKPAEERKVKSKEELRVGDIVLFYAYPALMH